MRRQTGAFGEQTAAAYLCANGFEIDARNWRCRQGELDIVAHDAQYLVLAEVKTRAKGAPVSGEEAVDRGKQARLRATAELYLQQFPTGLQPRFDVIVVEHDERDFRVSRHIVNAF